MAPLRAFLSVIDDVPTGYTIEHFRDELIEMLVVQQETVLPQLKPHLAKTMRSCQDLILDLYEGKPMRSGIDFFLTTAWLFVGRPVLLLKPVPNKNPDPSTNGPDYLFEKAYLLKSDKFVKEVDINMRFVFNGVDYYTPFYPEHIASVMHDGVPMLNDLKKSFKDLTCLMDKMPPGKSINSGLKHMHVNLAVVVAIAEKTNFATGTSDTSMVDQPAPAMDPLIAAPLRKQQIGQKSQRG